MSLLNGNSNYIIIDLIAVSKTKEEKELKKKQLVISKYKYIDFILVAHS